MNRTTMVDNITGAWLPTNSDSKTLGYNQRMIISDGDRQPPLVWQVSKILNTTPVGLTKFSFTQETFNPQRDNALLGLADYYKNDVEVVTANNDADIFTITHTGIKPSIRVGGSKTFTANLPTNNHFDIEWVISDGVQSYNLGSNNTTSIVGDYTVTTTDRTLLIKVAQKYSLVGTILTIAAHCADGNVSDIQVEVTS